MSRDGGADVHHQALPREVIHDVQNAKPLTRSQLISHEVQTPPLIGRRNLRFLLTLPYAELPTLLLPNSQPFSPVDLVDTFIVYGLTFPAQHQVNAPVSESRSFLYQCAETLDQALVFLTSRAVPSLRGPREAQHPAGPTFTDRKRVP